MEVDPTTSTKSQLNPGPNAVDVTPNQDAGVLKDIKREGQGDETPSAGDKVSVHYVGSLTDGSQFDSSRERGEEFTFELGKGSVIKAWDMGVATMKKGEIAMLYCQPEYAYGEAGSPPKIPANSVLVFEVELISWKGEDLSPDKDDGILRRHITAGSGYSTPNEGALVTIHLVGRHELKCFEERDVTFTLGEGVEFGIVEGIEVALEKFKKGEKSILQLKPQYAFGKEGKAEFNIPSDATVEYEVTLTNFEKAKDSWELDTKERFEQANIFKTKGTNFFKQGNYQLATKQYKKIIDLLEDSSSLENDDKKEQQVLLLAGRLNLAMCYLKTSEHLLAEKECDKALEIDPTNEKGFFRRGSARLAMHEMETAKEDFQAVLKIDPNNKAAANQIIVCNNKMKEQREKDKKLYSNMFTKMAQQDTKKVDQPSKTSPPKSKDVLQNPGTWGEEDSHFRSAMAQGDINLDAAEKMDPETKEKYIEACNLSEVEMIP